MKLKQRQAVMAVFFFLLAGVAMAGPGHHREAGSSKGPGQHYKITLPRPASDRDFYDNGAPDPAKVELGKKLFFDKLLSGNRNTSCATCHHALTDTGDWLSLPVGEGGRGLGTTRDTGGGADAVHERVPRNAPPVFNLGAREFIRMFYDGRVELDPSQPSGYASPAGYDLPDGLDNVLAVQAMFPVTSPAEMAGQVGDKQSGEYTIADAAAEGNLAGPGGVWEQLAMRLQAVPEYVDLFVEVYPEVNSDTDISYVHAANAIAAFEAFAWRATNSPFDRYLHGNRKAMSKTAIEGMKLFYGKAKCSTCHRGTFQTDQEFHAIGMPQIGPGKGDGVDGHDDFGRERVTFKLEDRYRFRTPTLRNVTLTGPWGHAGAYDSLEAVVRHHMNPEAALNSWDSSQVTLPSREDLDAIDFIVMDNPDRVAEIAAAVDELPRIRLKKREIRQLMDFLYALTDPASIDLRGDVPSQVPSGLPLAE